MTTIRRALLLAIADYDPPTPSLSYVAGDIPQMRRALQRMGIPDGNIEAHGAVAAAGQSDLSLSRMRKILRTFLESSNAGEDLLVYFSGHGAEIDGHRVLIPQDFDEKAPRAAQLIDDKELLRQARTSPAASVLFLIDACRSSYHLELTDDETKDLKNAPPPVAVPCNDTPTIAFVYSCARKETSGKDILEQQCSAFTRAFAEALEADDEAAQLPQVLDNAQRLLNKYVDPVVGVQTITVSDQRAHGRRGSFDELVVKENAIARLRGRLKNSPWVQQLHALDLWTEFTAQHLALATQVETIVLNAEDCVAKAAEILPQQRWRTKDAPFRLLERLEQLLLPARKSTAAETALLLAAPFVYELVLATAETKLVEEGAGLDPLMHEERPEDSPLLRAWRTAGLNDESGTRNVNRLKVRDDAPSRQAAQDVAAWRYCAFCHAAGELWSPTAHGWASGLVTEAVRPAPLREIQSEPEIGTLLHPSRLLRFARLLFAAYEDVAVEASGQTGEVLARDRRIGIGGQGILLDELAVAHALNLAARLALDARRLPPLLAEHLGCDKGLTLDIVQGLLPRAKWLNVNNSLSLALSCPHEALDAALREATEGLDKYRRRLVETGDKRVMNILPVAFTAGGLEAERKANGNPRYDQEHLRFTLEQDKVMGLLMGKELYGDPDFALRELYQNALDACRYRRAHEQYCHKQAPNACIPLSYQGHIHFRFGSENGRRFIECTDNGIGMADRHLRRLFACAGKRFTDSHEYHLDKAHWDGAGIPFYPNSRFGIGVLSYFMLAEELEVASQRAAAPGLQAPPHVHARVLGSGNLFRLDRDDATHFVGSGSRIRLYLEDRTRSLSQYRDAILKWLWLPEFETRLTIDGEAPLDLLAGEPSPRFQEQMGQIIPLRGSEDNQGVARAYWCFPNADKARSEQTFYTPYRSQLSAILADGILTQSDNEEFPPSVSPKDLPPFIAVNLTEELRPSLSVDRKRVLSTDTAVNFFRDCSNNGGWKDLASWRNPHQFQVGLLFLYFPSCMTELSNSIKNKKITFNPIRYPWCNTSVYPQQGIFDIDKYYNQLLTRDNTTKISPTTSRIALARLFDIINDEPMIQPEYQPKHCMAAAKYIRNTIQDEQIPTLFSSITSSDLATPLNPAYKYSQQSQSISPTRIIYNAYHMSLSVNEVAALATSLSTWGITVPEPFQTQTLPLLDERQLQLASRDFDATFPFLDSLKPYHLLRAAKQWDMPINEVVALAQPLASAGITLPKAVPIDDSAFLDKRLVELASRNLDSFSALLQSLTPFHLLCAANQWGMPINEVVALAQPLTAWGIVVPSQNEMDGLQDFDKHWFVLVSRDFDGNVPFLDSLTPWHMLKAVRKLNMPITEVVEVAQQLATWGISVPIFNFESLDNNLTYRLVSHLDTVKSPGSLMDVLKQLAEATLHQEIEYCEIIMNFYPILAYYNDNKSLTAVYQTFNEGTAALLRHIWSDATDISYALSLWNFIVAAEELGKEPHDLIDELEKLEALGIGNIDECRKFAEFYREQPLTSN